MNFAPKPCEERSLHFTPRIFLCAGDVGGGERDWIWVLGSTTSAAARAAAGSTAPRRQCTASSPGSVQVEDKETPRLFSVSPGEKRGASLRESTEQVRAEEQLQKQLPSA